MNDAIMEVLKKHLLEVSGLLTLAKPDHPDEETNYFLNLANARVVGLIKGLEIIEDTQPVTIGELQGTPIQ